MWVLAILLGLIIFGWACGRVARWVEKLADSMKEADRVEVSKQYFTEAMMQNLKRKAALRKELDASRHLSKEYSLDRPVLGQTGSSDKNQKSDKERVEDFLKSLDTPE